jgi:hypothetical protein
MIDGLRGSAALKELAALAQNLQTKLSLPVSVEVIQKLLDTKDGYKYLANVDGKLVETLSKKELEMGVKYWADGVKNQTTNTLSLENLIQKPQLLQSELFKSPTLSKALGFEKLVEVVKEELAKSAPVAAKTTSETPKTTEAAPTTTPSAVPQANKEAPSVLRVAAAELELSKPLTQTQTATAQQPTQNQKEVPIKEAIAREILQKEQPQTKATDEPKKTEQPPQTTQAQKITEAKEAVINTKETVLKELKAAVSLIEQKPEAEKEAKMLKEPQKAVEQKEKPSDEKSKAAEIKERLKEFKNVEASPTAPTKQEIERARLTKEELKNAAVDGITQTAKTAAFETLSAVLLQNFEQLAKGVLEEAAKKISDLIFGKLTPADTDEQILKILQHLEKQLEQKSEKEHGKKAVKSEGAAPLSEEEEKAKAAVEAEPREKDSSKTDNPASKLKAQLLEELAKVSNKSDFQLLSNVAMALNKEVFTFVLEDKGVLQFKKKAQKELNAKTVEFYSAFETLGPVSGEIMHIDGETSLSLNVEFDSTYRFLKENLKELSFFDKKNVSITHGIKEIVEIRNSFLDTTG